MHYKTTYVLPLLERQIYFQSQWHEDEEDAANRFFKMHLCQFNHSDQASHFFEANADLSFSSELSSKRSLGARYREYVLTEAGGLIAKFYDVSQYRWRVLYQGCWLSFVNQFATVNEPLYRFKLCLTDGKTGVLTLVEAKFLVEAFKIRALISKDAASFQAKAHFIENQIEALQREVKP